ncbi:MAG: hypothetical protein A2487_07390 [Candidatus Raymondbacteria bacterium RifOxyC12_full_50_8]|uniref:Uncharacterized protein n=1 Tax=Candidatus Raymondbacteria bacterium RIFOXYD12_FULL_49_13 TaxID=1817890 RepID=A0A1F7F6P5_UNCRA|nr:MAG: hypothetical protein A2350_06865 [Candidatus Raymondbacteria bacterium RifOxyB12_full_50_8]OGJ93205.1 MAG: hypothetical protein A2248_17695 [Candidatus Raymondbacteria bacterium RIFOXYA2_FULL_49_16]OGJ99424.1 MAG: hypothetical protein A2487_07390 [Candidatus Raymondbacteria bacterium RifOxyC12_full_50_8]OGK02311.1 MAG: hypothetical protein A2519_16725 [Candidatus Raymondbacteria bacterium RIFOXYD12_FULL_49_13]OGP44927.1 MAG: hypothetical protein A2324_19620 [Candidatus Raymondbacteria b
MALVLFFWSCVLFAAGADQTSCVRKAEEAIRINNCEGALLILAACSQDSSVVLLKGRAFHALFNADSAIKYLGMSDNGYSTADDVLLALAESMLWKKNFKGAEKHFGRVKNRRTVNFLKIAGMYLEMRGKLPEAVALYDSLMMVDKQMWTGAMRKAQVLSWMKHFEEATILFSQVAANTAAPQDVRMSAVIRRAEVRSWQSDFSAARHDLDSLIEVNTRTVLRSPILDRTKEALQLKGLVLEWEGKYQDAKAAYKNILLLDPNDKRAKLSLEKLLWVK